MKKVLAVLLAVLSIFSCFAVAVSAADAAQEPKVSDSGLYVGQIFAPGDTIKSAFPETCESLIVTYTISADDAEHVASKLQGKYADADFYGVISFRDNVASFSSGERFAGVYPVKDIGDEVDEMEITNGKFQSGAEITAALPKEERKKLKEDIVLNIDYAHDKDTLIQYTSLVGWEVVSFTDIKDSIEVKFKAVYETREPNGFENFLEKIYTKWCDFLDMIGDHWIKLVPEIFASVAKILGKNR